MKNLKNKIAKKEIQLQKGWNRIPASKILLDREGTHIKVLHRGKWNLEEGPDFKNAKIEIEGETITGDIEIHLKTSDWFSHGHDRNPEYENVILHVVAEDDSPEAETPRTAVLDSSLGKIPGGKLSKSEEFPAGKCAKIFSAMDDKAISNFFVEAGIKRFELKTDFFLKEMIESGSDNTLLRHLFEACGYRKNRENFLELHRRFSEHDLAGCDIETVLWGESDILPDPATSTLPDPALAEFVADTWSKWWKIRIKDRNPIKWKYSGVRPNNMPERRIAALCEILGKITVTPALFLAKKAGEIDNGTKFLKFLYQELISTHPLWDKYIFKTEMATPSSVLGEERASDIIANIILPALNACSRISGNKRLSEMLMSSYLADAKTYANSTLRHAFHRWFIPPSRGSKLLISQSAAQGVIHIYRNSCEKCQHDCLECDIFKSSHHKNSKFQELP